jgi:hypothetical protein
MAEATGTKLCIKCGTDCAGKPRTKDAQGRYTCKPCYEGAQKAAAPRAAKPVEPAEADDGAMIASLLESSPNSLSEMCPSCGSGLQTGAVVCTICGYNKETGRAIGVKVSKPKRDGPGLVDVLLNAKYTGLAAMVVFVGLLALGFVTPLSWAALILLGLAYIAVFWLLLVIDAFRTHVGYGVIGIIFPLYLVYFMLTKCERPMLKVHGSISAVLWIGIVVAGNMLPAEDDSDGSLTTHPSSSRRPSR